MRTCLARECVLGCLTRLKGVLVLIWDQHDWEQMHLHRKSAYLFAFGRLQRRVVEHPMIFLQLA